MDGGHARGFHSKLYRVQYNPMALSPMAHDDWTIVSIRSGVVRFKPGPLFQPSVTYQKLSFFGQVWTSPPGKFHNHLLRSW